MAKFKWIDRIEKFRAGEMTEHEMSVAVDEASQWFTCACGEQELPEEMIYSDEQGAPRDSKLRDFGYWFHNEWERAAKLVAPEQRDQAANAMTNILRMIEARAAELLLRNR